MRTQTGARMPGVFRALLATLCLGAVAIITSCSDSTAPPPPPNYPEVPVPDNPNSELPTESGFLTTHVAYLRNFSPKVQAVGPFIQELNKMETSLCLDFRVAPDRCALMIDGEPCAPTALQYQNWWENNWRSLREDTDPPCFRYLTSHMGNHYYISRNPATWMVADVNTRLAGGYLASIGSQAEQDAIFKELKDWDPNAGAWIGLTDMVANGNWFWRNQEPIVFTFWAGGEPNNYDGEEFAHIYPANTSADGRWNDASIGEKFYYIMETQEEFHGDDGTDPEVVLLTEDSSALYLRGVGTITNLPRIERRLYWRKVFQKTLGPGVEYESTHRYMLGTSTTMGVEFGYAIRVKSGGDWGVAKAEIETEFHIDFNYSWTVEKEEEWSDTYRWTSPENKVTFLALWQLRERFVISGSNGETWGDPNYELVEDLPYLDQGLRQDYLQAVNFDQ